MSDDLKPVAAISDLPVGQSLLVKWDDKEVALFNVEGTLYAIGNRCPHRSGPLVRGKIEKVSEDSLAVRCPIHGWLFDLKTGRCLTRASASSPVFPVSCDQEQICLGPAQGQEAGPSMPLQTDPASGPCAA